MKAIILAAGMGTRLGEYTKNLPKGMLEFNGKSLIEHQINTLKSVGVNDIVIVRGYKSEKINFSGVRYYDNLDYENTNMVESLFCAESEMDDDLIVCYSDIIYEKRIIKKVIDSDFDIGVVVDEDYKEYWSERLGSLNEDIESLVLDDEGRIKELGETNCSLDEAKLRYVGLIRFSKKGLEKLKKVYYKNKKEYFDKDVKWLRSKSFKKAYMTCMLQALINEGYEVRPIIISRGWLEFDCVKDYEKYNNWLKEGSIKRFIDFDFI